MLRSRVLCAFALFAFATLEGCDVSRVAGPGLDAGGEHVRAVSTIRKYGAEPHSPSRDGDGGGDPTQGGDNPAGTVIEADSLTVSLDHSN